MIVKTCVFYQSLLEVFMMFYRSSNFQSFSVGLAA